jgi:hypothetical protein
MYPDSFCLKIVETGFQIGEVCGLLQKVINALVVKVLFGPLLCGFLFPCCYEKRPYFFLDILVPPTGTGNFIII